MPSHTPDGRLWYSVNEAAAAAGVSRRCIYVWMEAGTLITRRTPSGTLRIAADCLLVEARQAS
jgi:predicted site-specific integrase-resolvase